MSVVIPYMLQNPYLISGITSSITAIGYGINSYFNNSYELNDKNIYKETSDFETKENFINITNGIIPEAPKLPNNILKGNTTLNIKIKTKYKDFNHFKKNLQAKNKRKRYKLNKQKNKKNINF